MNLAVTNALETLTRCGLIAWHNEAAEEIRGGDGQGKLMFGRELIATPFSIVREGDGWNLKIVYGNRILYKSAGNPNRLVDFVCAFYAKADDAALSDLRQALVEALGKCGVNDLVESPQDDKPERRKIYGTFHEGGHRIEISVYQRELCFLVLRTDYGMHPVFEFTSDLEFWSDSLVETVDYLCARVIQLRRATE